MREGTVLLVESDSGVASAALETLSVLCLTIHARSAREACSTLASRTRDWRAFIIDARLSDGSGLDVLTGARAGWKNVPALLLREPDETDEPSMTAMSFDLNALSLHKPLDASRLLRFVKTAPRQDASTSWSYTFGYNHQAITGAVTPAVAWPGQTNLFYFDQGGADAHLHRYIIHPGDADNNTTEDWGMAGIGFYSFTGKPCGVASWGTGRLDVVCPTTYYSDYGVSGATVYAWHRSQNSGALNAWQSYGNIGMDGSGMAAVSWGTSRLDAFILGSDHHVHHVWSTSPDTTYSWDDWGTSTSTLAGDPAVASWGSGRLDLLLRDSAGHTVFEHAYDSGDIGWFSWP